MKLRNLGVLGAAGLLAVTAAVPAFAQDKVLTIGADFPLSGGEVVNGQPTLNGVQLAIDLANKAGGIGGYTLKLDAKDDAVNGIHDPGQGAQNVNALIADESVIAMVGPFNSNVARAEIPVTNEAGLAQCSPSNTGTDLTQEGSDAYRSSDPAKAAVRNYFRTATPDNIQGPGLAQYAYNDLGARNAYVVDDTEAFGVGVANSFSDEFVRLGGTIAKRDGNDWDTNKSFATLLTSVQGLTPAWMWCCSVAPRSPAAASCARTWALRACSPSRSSVLTAHRPHRGRQGRSLHYPRGPGELRQRPSAPWPACMTSLTPVRSSRTTTRPSARRPARIAPSPMRAPRSSCRPSTRPSQAALPIRLRSARRPAQQCSQATPSDTILGPLLVDPNGDSGRVAVVLQDRPHGRGRQGWMGLREAAELRTRDAGRVRSCRVDRTVAFPREHRGRGVDSPASSLQSGLTLSPN